MEARISPAWDVRHRIAVGFGCAAVFIAAILAGAMQQAWEGLDGWQKEVWEDSSLITIGFGGIAAIFVGFTALVSLSFLIPSRRAATAIVCVLTIGAAWPLIVMAARIFKVIFFPDGMRIAM